MDVIFEKKNYFFTGDEVICKLGKIAKIGLFLVLATTESLFSNGNVQDTARANYFTQLANNYLNDLKYDSSLTYFRQAGEIWKIVGEKNKFLETQVGMSNILLRKGEKIKAFEILLNAEKIAREETYIHCSELGTIYTLLGYCYLSREEFDTAENYAKKGIDLNIKNFGEVHSKVASGYYTLGVVYKSKGEYDRAIDFLERAEKLQIVLYGKNYSSLANTYTSLGAVYDDKNEFARAIEYYKKALTILEITGRIYTADAGACYLYLMTSCGNKGDYHNAIEYGEKTIEIFTSLSLPEHLNVAGAYGKFGEIYTNLGDYEKAKEYLLRSLTIFTSKYPQNKSAAGMLYQHLGDVYKKTGDMENAIVYSEKGMKLFEQAYGEFHPQTGFMYEQLAGVYLEAKRFKDAIQYYNKAITARERVVNSHSRNDIASLYSSIGNVYLQQQLNDSALANLQKALMIESQSLEKNIPQRSLLQQRFGDLSYRQKQYSRALHYYQSAALALTQNNEPENVYLLPSFEKSIYKKELIEVVGNKARTFEMLYNQNHTINDLRAALSHYQKTMDLLDDARRQYSSDASKFYLSTISSSVYRNACRIALKLYEKTKDTQ